MFVTLFYAELDADGAVTYVNAGHNPALLRRATSDAPIELAPTGPMLGFDDAATFSQKTLQLGQGDFVLLYTDGVTEAVCGCADDACFGEEELRRLVQQQGDASASAALTALTDAVADFIGPTPPYDDVTVVGIKRLL